jgi:FkbM family methyltransferase
MNQICLGSPHGAKRFLDLPSLYGGWVISAGAGEDLSFDFELISKFDCKVLIIDPTPRAILHFKNAIKHVGKTAKSVYSESGSQPTDAYDLKNVDNSRVFFIEKALWSKEKKMRFFPPIDPSHVSYSLSNLQNVKLKDGILEVESTTVKNLCNDFGISNLALLKLDIEGAAGNVCKNLFSDGIFPKQIVIEFDELFFLSLRNLIRIKILQFRLFKNKYKLVTKTSDAEVSYLRYQD